MVQRDIWILMCGYSDRPVCNTETMIPVEYNPFTEPVRNVTIGITGNDANWVLWYLMEIWKDYGCDS